LITIFPLYRLIKRDNDNGFFKLHFLPLSYFYTHFTPTLAQPDFVLYHCSDSGNYTSNSAYRANLNSLLTSISLSTQTNDEFYNLSKGVYPDRVYAIAFCIGVSKLDHCRSCVNDTTHKLLEICPNQKEAIGFYDNCSLQFSNNSLFGIMKSRPMLLANSPSTVWPWDIRGFSLALSTLLDSLISRAASDDSLRKLATGNVAAPENDTIYALVQCTPDLDEHGCTACLHQAAGYIPTYCSGKNGGRVLTPSCIVRYETYSFYDPADNVIPVRG
jgi:hypothetical protein